MLRVARREERLGIPVRRFDEGAVAVHQQGHDQVLFRIDEEGGRATDRASVVRDEPAPLRIPEITAVSTATPRWRPSAVPRAFR